MLQNHYNQFPLITVAQDPPPGAAANVDQSGEARTRESDHRTRCRPGGGGQRGRILRR